MIVGILVAFACVLLIISSLGIIAMDGAANKLHYVGPVSTVVPILLAAAIVYEEGFTSVAGLKATCIALVMLVTGPIASYVTLRAIVTHEHGSLDPVQEVVEQ